MKKEDIAKLYNHIFIRLGSNTSIDGVGDTTQQLLNIISLLHQASIVTHKDYINLTSYIIGIAEDRIKVINYERQQKNDR